VRLGSSTQCGIIPSPTNRAPEIETASFGVQIQSEATHPLRDLIADEDGNLDLTSLRLIDGPAFNGKASGGTASIDAEQNLLLDYRGINFAGKELITVQVCDTDGLCAQQQLTIDVVGEVLVFNGITPDGDGVNDFMLIRFIDIIEGARKNSVAILNRWGDILIEIEDYNNADRVFAGLDSDGNELPPGTYMYRVQLASGKTYTGYITIKR
jgi:gliding motility-associated-like protein